MQYATSGKSEGVVSLRILHGVVIINFIRRASAETETKKVKENAV
jgi:hypothetical protein